MFRKLILFHGKITQYKKALLTKSDNAKFFKEEKEREKKKICERLRLIFNFFYCLKKIKCHPCLIPGGLS